jgi:Fe-S cluster assembly scaffold protein SufB
LFFLRSRGIAERDARQMLARAFATEVVDMLPLDALRCEFGDLVGGAVAQIGEPR